MANVGYDLDGTITLPWWDKNIHMTSDDSDNFELIEKVKNIIINVQPQLIPKNPVYIITNRPANLFEDITIDWLDLYEIKVISLDMTEKILDVDEKAENKAESINELQLDYYYEDESELRKKLSYLCPKTIIASPMDAIKNGHAYLFHYV